MPGKKTVLTVMIIVLAVAGITSLAVLKHPRKPASGKLAVVATIFPLYDFARAVGGNKIQLALLVPPGGDPHDFEPTPGDIEQVATARVFIDAGNALDPWSKSVAAAINNPGQIIADATAGINTSTVNADGKTTNSNPHVWLDFSNAQTMVGNIAQALCKADPSNKTAYEQNAAAYQKQLADLDQQYKTGLADCKTKKLVEGGHDAFDFMTNCYGLTYLPTQGPDPDAEPLPQRLAQLADIIKNDKLNGIFYEELESKKSAQTLADETGAKLLPINPGETVSTQDFSDNVTLIQIMEKNLANLKTGLQCQ